MCLDRWCALCAAIWSAGISFKRILHHASFLENPTYFRGCLCVAGKGRREGGEPADDEEMEDSAHPAPSKKAKKVLRICLLPDFCVVAGNGDDWHDPNLG